MKKKKKIEEYEKAIALRDNQIAEAKKILQGAKKTYNSVVQENQQLKEYINNIKKRYQEHLKQQEQKEFSRQKNYFRAQPPPKKYKKYTTKN